MNVLALPCLELLLKGHHGNIKYLWKNHEKLVAVVPSRDANWVTGKYLFSTAQYFVPLAFEPYAYLTLS